jgi:hypothetical protein
MMRAIGWIMTGADRCQVVLHRNSESLCDSRAANIVRLRNLIAVGELPEGDVAV